MVYGGVVDKNIFFLVSSYRIKLRLIQTVRWGTNCCYSIKVPANAFIMGQQKVWDELSNYIRLVINMLLDESWTSPELSDLSRQLPSNFKQKSSPLYQKYIDSPFPLKNTLLFLERNTETCTYTVPLVYY